MKHYSKLLFISAICIATAANAQHKQGIGLSFGANDFYGPQAGKYFTDDVTSINYNVFTQKNDTSIKTKFRWDPLIRLTWWYEISRHLDFNLGLSLGNVTYPAGKNDSAYEAIKKTPISKYKILLAELDARINYNILPKEEYICAPYIFAGLTASHHPPEFGVDLPIGLGLNFNLAKSHDFYLNLEGGYKVALTNTDQNHLQYTAGFVYWFKPGYKKPSMAAELAEALPPPDMDKDGVPDSVDKCPTIPGTAEFEGCPDTDGDGIPDNEDDCPLVAGTKAFNGCPDTDGDGIPDQKDKCPYVAGTADRGGCPVPDTDHDGIPDDQDKCPTVAGPASNNGCPVIRKEVIEIVEKAARSVYFETGKATLKKASYTSLNRIARVMKDDRTLYVDIAGYTDNVGKPDFNVELSDKRANACRDYLISQGISGDRMTAKGYGEGNPIATNKTALGRAQNRRTEFKLRNYK